MTTTRIEIGMTVKRIASDYTNGRIGQVIELDERNPAKPRARVSWTSEANGTPMKLRTWIRFGDLEQINNERPPVTVGQLVDLDQLNTRSNEHRALFETVENKTNWKFPTMAKTCATREEAQALADAITWFVGGAEISHDNMVMSRGYYYYIGA